jgi:alkanesulfonate monooxygenase SsuD/methylene tetrahydromethanopterin reductase-like flavin-dependent oxidoreductase (luciferase family)
VKLGIFDIFQVDPLRNETTQAMYARRLRDLALIDQLGFDAAFCAERHFLASYVAPSAVAWLAAASQAAPRLRLGSLAFTLPIKAPVQLAEDVAMLDHLTAGRLEVGFGLGHRIEELQALGQDPGQRVPLFQRRLAMLQALWTGGAVSVEQDDVIAREVAIHPVPLQDPHPPLWFAGTEPYAAQWMGARGLGLAVGFKPTAALEPTVAAYLAGAALAEPTGERPLGRVIVMRNVYVAERDEQALEEIAADFLRFEDLRGTGGDASRADRRERALGQAQEMIRQDVMLAGSPETVAAGIAVARDRLKADTFLANVYGTGIDDARIERTLRLLAGPVRDAIGKG